MDKMRELVDEFRTVFAGRGSLVDTLVPPAVFLIANGIFGFAYAMGTALGLAVVIGAWRLLKGQRPLYALGGLLGVVVAILAARFLGRLEGYFLPNIVSGGLVVLVTVLSLVVRRPLVAWTSYFARRWPLDWYWHPLVRPAYMEVTAAWTVFLGARWLAQWRLFRTATAGQLAVYSVLSGWPATVALLVLSYLYGTWRLRRLGGPSVEEFEAGAPPPWEGQRRGF